MSDVRDTGTLRAQKIETALRDLLDVIAADELIPESVSYMRQARAALEASPAPAVTVRDTGTLRAQIEARIGFLKDARARSVTRFERFWNDGAITELRDVLTLLEASPAPAGWQDISTAPKDEDVFFWIVPKPADEMYTNTNGEPMNVKFSPYRKLCKHGCWAANAKAVLWHRTPMDPQPAPASPEAGPDPNCKRCKGSGREPNAQFRCACRWRERIPAEKQELLDEINLQHGAELDAVFAPASPDAGLVERLLPLEICDGHDVGNRPLSCIHCARQLGRKEGMEEVADALASLDELSDNLQSECDQCAASLASLSREHEAQQSGLAEIGRRLKTGGMDDAWFLSGQIKGLLEAHVAAEAQVEALKAERDDALERIKAILGPNDGKEDY